MTKEQEEVLNAVRATHAYASDVDRETATYTTEGVGILLDLVEEQESLLECVANDLEDLQNYLKLEKEEGNENVSAMIDSLLMLIKYEE